MKAGVKLHEMQDMDDVELATYIRGYDLRVLDMKYFMRWMVAALLMPYAKKDKAIDPKELIALDNEVEKKGSKKKQDLALLKKFIEADKLKK